MKMVHILWEEVIGVNVAFQLILRSCSHAHFASPYTQNKVMASRALSKIRGRYYLSSLSAVLLWALNLAFCLQSLQL